MLVTHADISATLGREISGDELARVGELINQVSDLVKAYCRRNFGRVEGDVYTVIAPNDQTLELPGSPVHEVTSVEIDGVPVTEWTRAGSTLWRRWGWTVRMFSDVPAEVRIVYTHGNDDVPGDVKAVICQEVARILESAPGLASETVGDESRSYADAVPVGLSKSAKAALNRYRRKAGTLSTR
ncbi:hypothetical protein GCM10010466_29290 [Planomonospora alba]|uniref:Uncharacterized protein n=1 Tax=Planomonospora alba TaxID=161354 RepID=A0ABP6N597_9ACTN